MITFLIKTSNNINAELLIKILKGEHTTLPKPNYFELYDFVAPPESRSDVQLRN